MNVWQSGLFGGLASIPLSILIGLFFGWLTRRTLDRKFGNGDD